MVALKEVEQHLPLLKNRRQSYCPENIKFEPRNTSLTWAEPLRVAPRPPPDLHGVVKH